MHIAEDEGDSGAHGGRGRPRQCTRRRRKAATVIEQLRVMDLHILGHLCLQSPLMETPLTKHEEEEENGKKI